MKVFISWSGLRSQKVAELLNSWLRSVIQACRPWISTKDLDRGSLWFGEINDQLRDTTVGVICLTQENKNRPWILFEAGALAKGLSTSRVCTLLIDLESTDIGDPLAQFNHTFPRKNSIFALLRTLNSSLGTNSLDDRVLENVFETYWPQFEEGFSAALKETEDGPKPKPRDKDDVLGEILETVRGVNNRVRRVESELELNRDAERKTALINALTKKHLMDKNIYTSTDFLNFSKTSQLEKYAMINEEKDLAIELQKALKASREQKEKEDPNG